METELEGKNESKPMGPGQIARAITSMPMAAYWEGLIDRLYEELNQHGIYSTAEEPVSDNELEGVTSDDT